MTQTQELEPLCDGLCTDFIEREGMSCIATPPCDYCAEKRRAYEEERFIRSKQAQDLFDGIVADLFAWEWGQLTEKPNLDEYRKQYKALTA